MRAVGTTTVLIAQTTTIPMTGKEVPALVPYENALKPILQKWLIPGAALAISDQGRLVYARGFGYADKEAQIPVQPVTSVLGFTTIRNSACLVSATAAAPASRISIDAADIGGDSVIMAAIRWN